MRSWLPAVAVLLLASACGAPAATPDSEMRASAVYYGTETPSHVPLTDGQILAIGTFGFCSGTLITPTWVLTADHCGVSPGNNFCVGHAPDDPSTCFSVIDAFSAPGGGDLTIAEIAQDARDVLPEIEPISVLAESLDSSWIGTMTEAAGYGQTETGGYGTRLFTAEPLVQLNGDMLTIDGEGVRGVCYGDSGGPVMVITPSGDVQVAGALSWGDSSCVGLDHFTRTDTYSDWIEEHTGRLIEIAHAEILGPVFGQWVDFTATVSGPEAAGEPTAVTLYFSIGGASFNPVELTDEGGTWNGRLDLPDRGTIAYYLEARQGTRSVTTPARAPANLYGFYVGEIEPIYFDDFESDTGWFHGLAFGAGEGADDWQRGQPHGKGGDPGTAWSGSNVWGNDLGGQDWNGQYQADISNWLQSPEIDCSGCMGARLQFRRWLQVEDRTYDGARVLVNDTVVWENRKTSSGDSHRRDAHWTFQDIDISEIADGETISIRFELTSDSGLQFGGWTIDDVAVVVPARTQDGSEGRGCGCNLAPSRRPALPVLALIALLGVAVWRRRPS